MLFHDTPNKVSNFYTHVWHRSGSVGCVFYDVSYLCSCFLDCIINHPCLNKMSCKQPQAKAYIIKGKQTPEQVWCGLLNTIINLLYDLFFLESWFKQHNLLIDIWVISDLMFLLWIFCFWQLNYMPPSLYLGIRFLKTHDCFCM